LNHLPHLSDYEYRLYHTLNALAGPERVVGAISDELGVVTGGKSRSTVMRAVRALESHGLISVQHTRKAGGFQGPSKYVIHDSQSVTSDTAQSVTHATLDQNQSVTHDTATGDYIGHVASHDYMTNITKHSSTTYYYGGLRPHEEDKKRIPVVIKYDDGDDIGGFGLLEPKKEEVKINKGNPSTRWKRPEAEWTPADVAAEFSYQVGKKVPWAPGIVNQKNLRGALAKQRKDFNITALVELEILRMFLADDELFRDLGDKIPHLYKRYLSMFRTHLNDAHERLGLPRPGFVSKVSADTPARNVLTASDGTTFDDTIAGRAFYKKHEASLKGKVDS